MGGPNVWPLWITDKYYISTINRDELQKQMETGNYSPANIKIDKVTTSDNLIVSGNAIFQLAILSCFFLSTP